jgi:hypothetical protein
MKATAATIRARVDDILRILLDGAEPWDVRQYVAEKEAAGEPPWTVPEGGKPLSERQLRRYCARADKLLGESCRTNRKKLIRRHMAQRRSLYARAVSKGDERTALAVLRDLAELQDLYPARKTEVTGKGGGPVRFSVEEAVTADRELEEAERDSVQRGGGEPLPDRGPQVP